MMNRIALRQIVLVWALISVACSAQAAQITSSATPELRYAAVDGITDTFEAHHWMNAGMEGGFSEITLNGSDLGDGYSFTSEGHVLPGNTDYKYDLEIKKEDLMSLDLEFEQFRKYYSSLGGVHPRGESLRMVSSGRDLYVDIGKLELVWGLTPPNFPDIELGYEYEYKVGTKSRLTWSGITQGGTTLKTGPAWQEIDEKVHAFDIRISDDWKGLLWNTEQKWEHFTNHSVREERDLSVNTTASQRKVRDHILDPTSDLFSSIFELKRWFWKDKALASVGYRYSQIENSEVETILEMNENLVPTTFANPHQVAPSSSTNQYNSHTGVLSFYAAPHKDWTVGLKGKAEEIKKNGQSTLENDNAGAAPDGNIDRYDVNNTDSRILRFGEGVTIRYAGFQNLSLYNDVEFEQTDSTLFEDRVSSSAGELFNRETLGNAARGTEEIGFNYHPNSFLTWASQYRFLKDNIDFDDQFETVPTATGSKSAFVDAQSKETHEISTRATLNYCEWFSPTLRYQYRDHGYTMRYEANPLNLRSDTLESVYTVDLPIVTVPELMMSASWQYRDLVSVTPANEQTPQNYAPFHGDINAWMLSVGYLISKDITLHSSFLYQLADNVMDISSTGAPFGSDFDKIDLTLGLKWKVSKTVTLEPEYDYYHYDPNENVEVGAYDAHVAWLGISIEWA